MLSSLKRNPGFSLAVGSALTYTCYDVGVRAFLPNLTVWGLLFIRGCLGLVLATILARVFRRTLWGRHRGLLGLAGLCIFSSSVCSTTALSSIPLYQVLVILYLYPVFSLVLAVPVNGESISRRDLGLVALALIGCLGLVWPDEAVGLTFGAGHLFALSGALLYSLGQVLIRRLGAGNSGLEPNFYYSLYAAFLSIPLALVFESHLGLDTAKGLTTGLILASLGLTAQVSGYAALRWLPGFQVGLIAYFEVFLGAALSWLIFKDPMSLRALVGGLVIVWVIFQLRRTAPAKTAEPAPRTDLDESPENRAVFEIQPGAPAPPRFQCRQGSGASRQSRKAS